MHLQLQKCTGFVIVHRAEMPLTYSSASLCQRWNVDAVNSESLLNVVHQTSVRRVKNEK